MRNLLKDGSKRLWIIGLLPGLFCASCDNSEGNNIDELPPITETEKYKDIDACCQREGEECSDNLYCEDVCGAGTDGCLLKVIPNMCFHENSEDSCVGCCWNSSYGGDYETLYKSKIYPDTCIGMCEYLWNDLENDGGVRVNHFLATVHDLPKPVHGEMIVQAAIGSWKRPRQCFFHL
jgi:hypothetical protein